MHLSAAVLNRCPGASPPVTHLPSVPSTPGCSSRGLCYNSIIANELLLLPLVGTRARRLQERRQLRPSPATAQSGRVGTCNTDFRFLNPSRQTHATQSSTHCVLCFNSGEAALCRGSAR